MGLELLFLLLPIAALSGWWVGRRKSKKCPEPAGAEFYADYFKGLNYLLNEEQDKAINVFIHLLDVDQDTVDIHLALGSLFRRRGEVDRAIRIHQNLIARPNLNRAERNQALYELAVDYMRAGLLDRSESLCKDLSRDSEYRVPALHQLLDVYQQEKEWDNAIGIAQQLESSSGENLRPMIAHFHCEQAEGFWRQGNKNQAKRLLGRALTIDRNCVRASLLEAEVELQSGDYKTAIRILKQIEHQEPAYLSEIVEPLRRAYLQWGRVDELIGYLRQLLRKHSSISLMLALADLIQQQEGESEAANFISEYLHTHPSVRGMARLIDIKLGHSQEPSRDDLQVLKELTDRLLEDKPVYCCSHCGFQGKTLNWQCPSCKHWNTTRPIHGIEGE